MTDVFTHGTDWQQSSSPILTVTVHESDVWPQGTNSGSGTKDALNDGDHPVLAIGDRAGADRASLLTGVVESVLINAITGTLDQVVINIAPGAIVRSFVNNTLTYGGGVPATFETTPYVGQPVYVDDSNDLAEGVTLSMSPLNDAGAANPLAGYLWYCQDELADSFAGGARATPTFDTTLPNAETEQEYCVLLTNAI